MANAKKSDFTPDFGVNPNDFHEEKLGIRPYWQPLAEKNKDGNLGAFFARVVDFDDKDPEFHRWVFQANHATLCYSGPTDDQEEVIVKKGECFNVSGYAQLENLRQYHGLDILLICTHKTKVKKGNLYHFTVKMPKETYAILAERRAKALSASVAPKQIARSSEPLEGEELPY